MPRFVILRHQTPPGYDRPSHWDFMLDADGRLRTWTLMDDPQGPAPQSAELLGDHRIDFLEYEGPLSNDRGTVSRWDAGTYETLELNDLGWLVALRGRKLIGRVQLSRHPDRSACYHYQFEPTPEAG